MTRATYASCFLSVMVGSRTASLIANGYWVAMKGAASLGTTAVAQVALVYVLVVVVSLGHTPSTT